MGENVNSEIIKFCKKCSVDTARYSDGRCKPCAAAYQVAYTLLNKDKIADTHAKYYAANREYLKGKMADWYVENTEKAAAYGKNYRAANREKVLASKAAWHAANRELANAKSTAWRAANPERKKANDDAWRAANPEKTRINKHNRRARERSLGGKLSVGLSDKLFKLQRGKCACGCKQSLGTEYHMDHIMPLALGGRNEDSNIQLLHKSCNLKKNAKHPIDFMQSLGFLL